MLALGRCLVAAGKLSYFTGGLQLPDFLGGRQASRDSCVNMTIKLKGWMFWKCHWLWEDGRPLNLPAQSLLRQIYLCSPSFCQDPILNVRDGRLLRSGFFFFPQNLQQIIHLSETTLPDTNIIFSSWQLLSIYFWNRSFCQSDLNFHFSQRLLLFSCISKQSLVPFTAHLEGK